MTRASMSPKATPLRRDRSRQAAPQVLEHLRERILSLDLAPGTLLSRAELAGQYGMSQTPVRDALITPRRGRAGRHLSAARHRGQPHRHGRGDAGAFPAPLASSARSRACSPARPAPRLLARLRAQIDVQIGADGRELVPRVHRSRPQLPPSHVRGGRRARAVRAGAPPQRPRRPPAPAAPAPAGKERRPSSATTAASSTPSAAARPRLRRRRCATTCRAR